ncbi:hypothetical protein FOXG_22690 [Fusarium oxysporum f. sp. lycopersici 4287]|uniref:Uncharacterized protein n=1 Tax=Fusarium oxysporum f. sp. lycopersici (strain 4287 / CBS 123668 / FGSC 9935 / NRRL 34936) TaxID=426428 RepID=A0A0J9VT40_FUSO4|nr:hypothetical protein FOXG_20977 [Fusarium oxysporum f. sp. lycopersici 4287]XP_018252076.1 hypothetical protein FOXG_21018 [Fusarium oxysporum f. sp. lycopersici 4287]XP_018253507.1 hypothetical protein FOXG_21337 [Fusarium oxysporum f. sp. lycopersici 4287]XP_018257969.1 hypothetical protein FOXG_22690 [Fusarium oxysporum f. sp. lycopersici 4287]KNB13926.1 hypothetical protein FOXG_20977 [Fusarium oxysporum f. sp. lycopersici 4287]KNB14031.1 hypothetical protein FOXG_21018 [Fusarium oxyspo
MAEDEDREKPTKLPVLPKKEGGHLYEIEQMGFESTLYSKTIASAGFMVGNTGR